MRLSRPRSVPASSAAPAFVRAASASSGAASVASQDVVLPGPATAGNLLVVCGSSDAPLTAPSGMAVAAQAVNAQALYLWWRIAAGGETTFTATPSVSRPVALVAGEWSGIAAASPVDRTASATSAGSSTAGPVSAGTTAATTQPVELVLAATGPHTYPDSAAPTAPTWSAGFTGRAAAATTFATNTQNAACFLADLVVTEVGAQSTATSWTNSAFNWGAVIATFRAA